MKELPRETNYDVCTDQPRTVRLRRIASVVIGVPAIALAIGLGHAATYEVDWRYTRFAKESWIAGLIVDTKHYGSCSLGVRPYDAWPQPLRFRCLK